MSQGTWIVILILAVIGTLGALLAAAYPAADARIGHGGAALIGFALAIIAFTNL